MSIGTKRDMLGWRKVGAFMIYDKQVDPLFHALEHLKSAITELELYKQGVPEQEDRVLFLQESIKTEMNRLSYLVTEDFQRAQSALG